MRAEAGAVGLSIARETKVAKELGGGHVGMVILVLMGDRSEVRSGRKHIRSQVMSSLDPEYAVSRYREVVERE